MPSKSGREFDVLRDDDGADDMEWTFVREASTAVAPGASPAKLNVAKSLYAIRRSRDRLAGPHIDLFSEPAWDLLLDLYVALGEDRNVTVSRACVASGVPTATTLRWLQTLQDRGLMSREDDVRDSRKTQLALTIDGMDLVERLLPDRLC